MKIIGICGASGSGKSTVCGLLAQKGVSVFDCDVIYHELVSYPSPCLEALAEAFGESVIRDGSLDRAALREVVFADDEALLRLNRITHQYVKNELKSRLERAKEEGTEISVIDAPMLFEAGLEPWCDLVCAVVATKRLQVERICDRDHIAPEQAEKRLEHQIPPEELTGRVDLVIENNGDLQHLEQSCERLINTVRKMKPKLDACIR